MNTNLIYGIASGVAAVALITLAVKKGSFDNIKDRASLLIDGLENKLNKYGSVAMQGNVKDIPQRFREKSA